MHINEAAIFIYIDKDVKDVTENPCRGYAGSIPVYCSHDKIVPVEELKPNPKNPNRHPGDQVELLAKVIETQGWRQPVKVSARSGFIVSGHGRYEAALYIGCPVPVDFQDYPRRSGGTCRPAC